MDLPFSAPNSPTSTLTEANEFVLRCLEPLSVERPPSPMITQDLLDSLQSPVIPPSDYLGPTLEEYLDSCIFPSSSTLYYSGAMSNTPASFITSCCIGASSLDSIFHENGPISSLLQLHLLHTSLLIARVK